MAISINSLTVTTTAQALVSPVDSSRPQANPDYGLDLYAKADNETDVYLSFDSGVTASPGPGVWVLGPGEWLPLEVEFWQAAPQSRASVLYAVTATGTAVLNYKGR